MTTFQDLGLAEPILRALAREGYEHPTPVQELAIPPLLKGSDVLGVAQTGTGKTAAFALPVLQTMMANRSSRRRVIRALVLSPTRELAAQIGERFAAYAEKGVVKLLEVSEGPGPAGEEDPAGDDFPEATLAPSMLSKIRALKGLKDEV